MCSGLERTALVRIDKTVQEKIRVPATALNVSLLDFAFEENCVALHRLKIVFA